MRKGEKWEQQSSTTCYTEHMHCLGRKRDAVLAAIASERGIERRHPEAQALIPYAL